MRRTSLFIKLSPNPILDTSSPNKFYESLAAGVPVIQATKVGLKITLKLIMWFNLDGNDSECLSDLLIKLKIIPRFYILWNKIQKMCS